MDLEKHLIRVAREVIRWEMHKLGLGEWLVSMYVGVRIVFTAIYGNSDNFEI